MELLRRVVDLESFHSSERQRITKLKPKLFKKARVLREKLEKKFSIVLSPTILLLRLFIVVVKFSLVRFLDMELLNCLKKKIKKGGDDVMSNVLRCMT